MRKYYVTVKNWHKIRRRPMEVLLATHDLTTRMRSGVIMSFFRPHVHSICMRCINWPSMKWTTLHASNYHMGWILVQNCVRPCTRVCVRGNECVRGVRAHLRFVHVPPVWLREDEYILLEPAARHCDQSTQGGRDNASTCATWLHEL